MELAWILIGLAAIAALFLGAVILFKLAKGWDDQAPGDSEQGGNDVH